MSSLDTKGETSPLGRLKAIFSLGFTSAFPIIQTLLSDFSDNSLDRLRLLMNETGIDLTRKKYGTTIKQFLNEFNAFLLTESQVFGDDKGGKSLLEKRNYYIHDFPIKFKDMMNARDDKGSPMYPNIISLPSIKRISNRADKGLKMDNIGKISPETRKWYVEAFDALLNLSTDNKEEKEAARKLAADLLLYSFYDNGMTFRHNSFSNFFSSTYMQSIPGLIDALRRADNINRSSNYYDERFLFQFLLNHPTYIKPIKRNQVTIQDNGNTLKIKLNSEHELPSEVYSGAQGRNFVEFLKVQVQDKQGNHKTEIFRKMSDSESTLWYQRITPQNTGTPYYDINSSYDDINFELIKARGNSKVRLDRVKKMNNKQSKVNSYSGDITPEKNTIFVFGSNPEGRHGAGAAKTAKEKFGAEPGVGEGLTGNAYALPTKDLRVKENGGLRSISKEDIIDNISKLYKVAQENPSLQFKVAYRNKPNETTLNGYTGAEMIEMFKAAGAIPRNVIFSSEWVNSGLFEDSITASTEPLVTDNFTDNEFDPSSASNINDSPIDIPTTQDNDYTEDDIRKAARNLGSIIGEAISEEFLKKAADSHAAKEKNKTKSFEELSKKDNGLCKG
jgi:hypothetical protein